LTSKVTSVLKDAAKSVVKSAKNAGEAFAKHIEATGSKLKGDAKAHKETDAKNKDGLTKAGSKKADEVPKSDASKAEKSAADKAAAEKAAADKAAADKAAAEKAAADAKAAAEKAAAIKKKVADLRTQGHAPQRHLDATDQQLEQRLGTPVMQGPKGKQTVSMQNGYVASTKKVDPANTAAHSLPDSDPNKYLDNYSKNAAGNPNKHKCGSFSTAFGDEQSMVSAEAEAHKAIPAGSTSTHEVVSIDAKTAIGEDGVNALRGKYIDPANPLSSTGSINYKNVNFANSKITAVWSRDDATKPWSLTTMYPEPDQAVNP
jgi:hypothetical protein